MFPGYSPVIQALQGTLFTWGLTALGAATAILIKGNHRIMLDISLGFAGGVMLAASYWSLLGALFVYGADVLMNWLGVGSPMDLIKKDDDIGHREAIHQKGPYPPAGVRRRNVGSVESNEDDQDESKEPFVDPAQWRRILLLIVAITVHNIPEGLAVGVGFGAVGRTKSATFESARNLAIGIGIQNFPEGLSVSLPLKAAGFSTARAVWYGQLSGLVEPFAGVLGAALVTFIVPILPYALSFAAGAMVYVVVDDIVPEAHAAGNGKAASWGVVVGFIIMMSLDVALG